MHRLRTPLARPGPWLILILIAYALYAAGFIWTTSAIVPQSSYNPQAQRYFVLFDDMMISMRYAKNLANGDGLVWNPGGERVEGFTNPLWVGYMALWHVVGLPAPTISLAIQLSGAVFLLLTLIVVWRLALVLAGDGWVGVGAALFTAFYLPLNTWSLQGTEVSVLTLITTLATLIAVRALQAGRFSAAPYLLLGLATWIRLDMAVPLGAIAVFLAWNDRPHRAQHVIVAAAILALFVGPQFALRRWYYGEWLPNTYALKMQGYPMLKRILHGLEIALRLGIKLGPLPLGILLFRRDRAVRLLVWVVLGQIAYNVYVGGDAWEHYGGANRYVSVAMPLVFLLLALTLRAGYAVLLRVATPEQVPPPQTPPPQGGRGLTLGVLPSPPVGEGNANERSRGMGGRRALTPRAARIGLLVFGASLLLAQNYTYGTGAWEEWLLLKPSLYASENRQKVEQALLLEALTAPDATVALSGAGIVPYFADRPYVDLLGKNDRHIAHLPMDQTIIPEFKPGHMKWDYAYSIGELRPDVVLELWVRPQDAGPILDAHYVPIWFPPKNGDVWMLKDSPRVLWERIWG